MYASRSVNRSNKRAPSGAAIFVPQADSIGAVAVIRSLGQNGYKVHAASCKVGALGCASTFAHTSYLCPTYKDTEYLPWLRNLILKQKIVAIIPSEGFLLAIRDCFSEFSSLMAIPEQAEIVYGCLSKVWVFDQFLQSGDARLSQHIPRTKVISQSIEFDKIDFNEWRLPFFIKGDGFYAKEGDQALVQKVESILDARKAVVQALCNYDKILLQDYCSGVKATVNLLIDDGNILAESMVLARHENPHTGGLTTLRHSWWHQTIYEDAVFRLKALNWNGPAMLEYKWDQTTQCFTFIELNARYWAALNLDILAGLHFPAIQMQSFLQKELLEKPQRLTRSITVRNTFPADVGYLLSKMKDPKITFFSKVKSFLGFFLYFFHPGIKSDLIYPGDRQLYWLSLKNFILEHINHVKKN